MLSFSDLINWFQDAENWSGRYGLLNLFAEHMWLTFSAIALAALVALPLGVAIGHFRKAESAVVAISSASRAVPTMGLMFALVMLIGVEAKALALTLALVAIAIPPLLAGAYSGITAIPRHITDASVAQGMTDSQLVRHVELPLAAPSIIGGFRLAYIQVVSTIVLAPLVGLGGLGFGIIQGLALRDFAQVSASALVIVVLTVIGDQIIGKAQRLTLVAKVNSIKSR
jgi:osmoprotectant transport system permease protein